ncbi:hypothetical protein AGMMS4957_18260 [Bacteroidia bacterium]|nr:hypothetical protein AGMMS4957_18260 [Bacteroidia bacterium]
MVNLGQYFKEEDWNRFFELIVPRELEKNREFYDYLDSLGVFSVEINKVLASLYPYMFFGKRSVFERWINMKHTMLDDNTPIEILQMQNGEQTLKEYLMRYPLLI